MNVLVLASSLGGGGAERAAAIIAEGLNQRHSVVVMTFHSLSAYPWTGRRIDLGLPYDPAPAPLTKVQRFLTKFSAIRRVLEQERPDVVLAFSEGPTLAAITTCMLVRTSVSVVAVAQNRPLAAHRGVYRVLYGLIARLAYKRASSIVSLSEGVAEEFEDLYRLERNSVVVIPNPVDTRFVSESSREPLDESVSELGDVPILLTVGRLEAQKNHALLLRAFARVRDEVEAQLLIAGTGRLKGELERLAADLGVRTDVRFLGWVNNPFSLMKRATVFVLSSNFEGLGNVILEALACGCPVISTDCPFGPADILAKSEAGILVPVGDEGALAKALLDLLRDSDMRRQLSERGRRRARDFEASMIVEQYARTLESTCERLGRSAQSWQRT
jgi:glycosyltransferase involved in cell wall biosynthesis